MTDPGSDGQRPEFTDSDLEWFAALSGGQPANPDSPAAREGLALRIALEQRSQEAAASEALAVATSDEAMRLQLQQLQQRARRERILERDPPALPAEPPPAPTSTIIVLPWWRGRRAIVALAASVLLAAVLVKQLGERSDYPPPPVMMGADGARQVRTDQPRQTAERFADRLRLAGMRPGLYQRGEDYVVDITLMAAELPAVEPAFAALGLQAATGFNRVELVRR